MNTTYASLPGERHHKNLFVAALGVVFGDIGTSPLYTMKQCFGGAYGVAPNPENVLGILSLVFWSICISISFKYVVFVMQADNKGEGGIMALMSLIQQKAALQPDQKAWLVTLGLIGASLFYGDGFITPAISVMGAVEGLEVFQPGLHAFVIPLSLAVLLTLFLAQKQGTSQLGATFGIIMLIWFVTIGLLGLRGILANPDVLQALNPLHAVHFFGLHHWQGLMALGGVVLAITGGEALYADMGHFGRTPIQRAWFLIVMPCLLLNYFGQGALLSQQPEAVVNPFYHLVPAGILPGMIVLATLATVIASQAVISGAFSLTAQAIQLGFCPRFAIHYTSEEERGQVYIPWVNWALLVGIVGLILGFRTSSNLAAAYGLAVTGTMTITTILAFFVIYRIWKWNPLLSSVIGLGFLSIDLAFLTANGMKFLDGGWLPIIIGALVFLLLTTWKEGRELLHETLSEESVPVDEFLAELREKDEIRVPGTAVFLTSSQDGIPYSLLHNFKHNKVLHETVLLMTIETESVPRVPSEKRREVKALGEGLFRIILHYGFMENPNIPRVLKTCSREFRAEPGETTFFMSRETIIPRGKKGMPLWRGRLFASMARNTGSVIHFLRIPPDRVIEIGIQMYL
jgi:KUP system potassium uptake protein